MGQDRSISFLKIFEFDNHVKLKGCSSGYSMADLIKKENRFMFVGLGNPGREFEASRHNVGFLAIDAIVEAWKIRVSRYQRKAMVGKGRFKSARILLVKPQTFMNLSGNSVSALVRYYKIPLNHVMVLFDDLDIPFGELRIRKSGGSSGQKGMRSIIEKLGTQDFPRLRIGVGRPPGRRDPADFILDTFTLSEQPELPFIFEHCRRAVETFIESGIDGAMMKFNHSVLDDE